MYSLPSAAWTDELNYVKVSLGNLYHELCHRYIHRDRARNAAAFRGTCKNLFFVVMGAPTQHWAHPWTSGKASSEWSQNDEQWPYRVQFEQTKPL